MHLVVPLIVLLFTYLALSSSVGVPNLILGVLVATAIVVLIRPRRRPVNWSRLPTAFGALGVYLVLLLRNFVMSGIKVSYLVIHPDLPIDSGIVALPPECDSERGRAMSAHAISMPPGELFIEMDEDGTMYIHSLDVADTERSARASQEKRRELMKKIFD